MKSLIWSSKNKKSNSTSSGNNGSTTSSNSSQASNVATSKSRNSNASSLLGSKSSNSSTTNHRYHHTSPSTASVHTTSSSVSSKRRSSPSAAFSLKRYSNAPISSTQGTPRSSGTIYMADGNNRSNRSITSVPRASSDLSLGSAPAEARQNRSQEKFHDAEMYHTSAKEPQSHPMSSTISSHSGSTLQPINNPASSAVSSATTAEAVVTGASSTASNDSNQSNSTLGTNSYTPIQFNKDNYDQTVFRSGWLNRSHGQVLINSSNENSGSIGGSNRRDSKMFDHGPPEIADPPLTIPDYKLYRVQLRGPLLNFYKSGLSSNVKCFDPNLGNGEHDGALTDGDDMDLGNELSNKATSTASTPTISSPTAVAVPVSPSRNAKPPTLKYLSPQHPHPDLKVDREGKIVSGTMESLCHAILFGWPHTSLEDISTSENRHLINLLLSLPILDDFYNFLAIFDQFGLTFTKHSGKINIASTQYCNVSSQVDDQLTDRLALVVKTLLDMLPSLLLDEPVLQKTVKLLDTISLHSSEISSNLKVAVTDKHIELNKLTAFGRGPVPSRNSNKSLADLMNPDKFLRMDIKHLAEEVHGINLRFRLHWAPSTDYSLLYDSKFIDSKIVALNPLVFNNNKNVHFLGRLFVSHVFPEGNIISARQRGKILSKWVEMGVRFEHLGDMVSWLAVATIVCSVPILRLYQAWQYVSEYTIRIIFKDWVPTIAQLNRRQLSSKSTSSVFILAPPNLEDPVIRSNVISYFGDLIIHADDLPSETKLKYLEKKINRTNNAFRKWQQRLDNLSKERSGDVMRPTDSASNSSVFYQFWKYHLSLPPLNSSGLMELSTKLDPPRVDQKAYSSIGSQRSPLLTGSYLPVLFNELLPNYSLFSRQSLIGAAGVVSTTMTATAVPSPTRPKSPIGQHAQNINISGPMPLENSSHSNNAGSDTITSVSGGGSTMNSQSKADGNQITGVENIDGPVVKAMSTKQSSRQHLLKCIRDAFNIDSDIFRVSDDFIFKSCNDSDLASASSSTVIENPKRFSQHSSSNAGTGGGNRESQDVANTLSKSLENIDFFNKESETLKESVIPVVLKSGSLEKMFDLLVLTAGVFSRLVETKDLENYFHHNKERNIGKYLDHESKDQNLGLLDFAFIRLSMDNETFTETFFNTYRSFTTTVSVLENLAKRYIGAKSCAVSITKLLNGFSKVKSTDVTAINDQKFPVWDMNVSSDENLSYTNWSKIQVGAAESLYNLVKNHYADFTDDMASSNTLLDIMKIMEEDVGVEWPRRIEHMKKLSSPEDVKETQKYFKKLSELFTGIRSAYQKQMYRPLGVNRTQRKVTSLLDSFRTVTLTDYNHLLNLNTIEDSMVAKFHELRYNDYEGILDWVYELDNLILQQMKLITKQDWFAVYQVLELFSYESLTSYFSFPQHKAAYNMITSGSSQLDDLEIMNVFSWIRTLTGANEKGESRLLKTLPESVQLLIRLHTSLTSFFTVEISDTAKNPDSRLQACAVILQILNYVRWKNSALDLFEEEGDATFKSISPHIPSFIETAISDAIVSPESRYYEHTWRATHSLLSYVQDDYLPSVCRILDNIDDKHVRSFVENDGIYMAKPKNLCPCTGWLILRLIEIAQFVPNMSTMNSKLINFDKRRFVSNIISNIVDLIPASEDYTNGAKEHDSRNFGNCLSLEAVDPNKDFRKSTRIVAGSESKMLKFQENGLFNEILSEEVEKIRRDQKKIEALSAQEHENKRSAVLQKVMQRKPKTSVMLTNLQPPSVPSSPVASSSSTFARDKRSSVASLGARSSLVSNSGHNHMGRKLGGFFRRPFSIGGFNSSTSNNSLHSILVPDVQPNGTVAPMNLPVIDAVLIQEQKPVFQVKTFEIENVLELMNYKNAAFACSFKIIMQGGQEIVMQATGTAELKQWVRMIKASRRYAYYSKRYKSKTYNKVFAVPLEDVCEREGTVIPNIVVKLLEEIELRGLDEVGLYRIPGSVGSVNALKNAFDEEGALSNSFTLEDDRWFEINAIAGCFKMYLRELPECLFTNEKVQHFANIALRLKAQQLNFQEFTESMVGLLKTLPLCYYQTLKRIVLHLNKVHQHMENNRMDASNLAIVFSMSFINQEDLANSMGSTLGAIQTILQFYIKSPQDFFD